MTVGSVPCVNGHIAPPGGAYCTRCGTALGPPSQVAPYGAGPAGWAATPNGPYPYAAATYPAAQYGPNPVLANRAMNGMAIASMVLGILWIYGIGSILALVFGYVARSQIKARNESGGGMAIAGVVLGWVGVGGAIIVIIIAVAAASGS